MIKFFCELLQEFFCVPNEKVKIHINCYTDMHDLETIEQFWVDTLGLTESNLRKPTVNNRPISSKKTKRNKLPYGVCRLVVGDVKIVQAIYGALQEFLGINRSEWIRLPN